MVAGRESDQAPDFRALFEAAPGLYLIVRPDLTIAAVSDAYLAATRTRRADILGRGIFEVFPDNPDDPKATGVSNLKASLLRAIEHGVPDTMAVQKFDVRRPASEGGGYEERYWSPVNTPVRDGAGNVAWVIHRVEDVTDFIRLQRQGRAQARRAQGLLERVDRMAVDVLHRAQQLQETNRALRQSEERLRQLNETLEQRVLERTRQLEAEVRNRERAQEAFRETQKLEAIGRLAGGVAHDFNNLLTVIHGSAELLLDSITSPDDVQSLKTIERAAERGARLTRQLLAFSRQQALRPERIDLRSKAQDITELLQRSLRGDIRIVLALDEELWPIQCDLGELELALLNLCVNARDAMPSGGLIRIDATNLVLPTPDRPADAPAGDFVSLNVTDTGIGIEPAVLARVFEPFFTTKEVGKGTGIGLSQVHGFAQQAGGRVTIESTPGRGTTVSLLLPRSTEEPAAGIAEARLESLRSTGTVLLVEDDDDVAAVTTGMLRLIGYQTRHARDPRTALALLLGGQRFGLVFSDIVMPGGMPGLEFARKVRQHFPHIPILLTSGYSHAAAEVVEEGFIVLAKPYRADTLSDAIRQCLASERHQHSA
ncbi:response regulator [Vineibacter terrae]|uniref:histidine kinase n=1 Tax=Vineibacter terrae TaxID=2586908 RepID=A0A5C8PEJ0_9HYPH|nr:ATP-binding protein [Vineibacter terrae]TXL71905.1 response regulator [Vineibacter terrae]